MSLATGRVASTQRLPVESSRVRVGDRVGWGATWCHIAAVRSITQRELRNVDAEVVRGVDTQVTAAADALGLRVLAPA